MKGSFSKLSFGISKKIDEGAGSGFSLSEAVLDAVFALGVFPFHGAIDAGDHAGATFETTGKFHDHLSFLIQGVEICRAGIDAESFLAGVADFLVEKDVGLFIVFKGIESQLSR